MNQGETIEVESGDGGGSQQQQTLLRAKSMQKMDTGTGASGKQRKEGSLFPYLWLIAPDIVDDPRSSSKAAGRGSELRKTSPDPVRRKGEEEQHMEAFNPVETSRKVLEMCNVVRKANQKVKRVGMGEGHLISTLDNSVAEVYKKLYNKDLSFPPINHHSVR